VLCCIVSYTNADGSSANGSPELHLYRERPALFTAKPAMEYSLDEAEAIGDGLQDGMDFLTLETSFQIERMEIRIDARHPLLLCTSDGSLVCRLQIHCYAHAAGICMSVQRLLGPPSVEPHGWTFTRRLKESSGAMQAANDANDDSAGPAGQVTSEEGSRSVDEGLLIVCEQPDAHTPPAAWIKTAVAAPKLVAYGEFHQLAVGREGVYSWGRGLLGTLGHGSEEDEAAPRLIDALAGEQIVALSVGACHSAALTLDGRLFCWGCLAACNGELKELAEELVYARRMGVDFVPRRVSLEGALRVTGVACGARATAAWDERGRLLTWGFSSSGQLGHGTESHVATPRPVEALTSVSVVEVAFGGRVARKGFMLVRSKAGRIYSCGTSARGRLGRLFSTDPSSPLFHAVPSAVHLGPDSVRAASVAASESHGVALSANGAAFVWGANEAGLLGLEPSDPDVSEPMQVVWGVQGASALQDVSQVACSAFSTAFLVRTTAADNGQLILLGGDPQSLQLRRAGLPPTMRITAVFGGGRQLGLILQSAPETEKTPEAETPPEPVPSPSPAPGSAPAPAPVSAPVPVPVPASSLAAPESWRPAPDLDRHLIRARAPRWRTLVQSVVPASHTMARLLQGDATATWRDAPAPPVEQPSSPTTESRDDELGV